MASTSQHPTFPSRPYSNTLHGKLPDRAGGPSFGIASTRETARLERERAEREQAQRESQQQQQQQQQGQNQQGGGGGPGTGARGQQPNLSGITDEQRDEINEAFNLFDIDKDQRIDYHEFKVSLKALGFDLPKSEILSLLQTHGSPSTQPLPTHKNPSTAPLPPPQQTQKPPYAGKLLLSLPSFQSIAAALIAQRDPRDEILRAFDLFDTEGKGVISLEDLRRVARELGEGLEEEELVAMIEEFDLEGKGGVGKEEFVAICMG